MAGRREIQVNSSVCTGCRLCELVCTLFHEGRVNPERARIWIREDFGHSLYEPHICQLCQPAPCVEACPLSALSQDTPSGIIALAQDLCNGCLSCVSACPHGAIRWSPYLEQLSVCDRCGGEPTCVPFCHRGALKLLSP